MKWRYHIVIRGAVQGVGFRPFIYRLANSLRLAGWILNNGQGVIIEVEGEKPELDVFIVRIDDEKPRLAMIQSLEYTVLDCVGYIRFEIRTSEIKGETTALVLPDIATCPDCRNEIFDPSNRRYRYPFTNCTNCGPRYSIIEALPYDRTNTTMKGFIMCDRCAEEYHDPDDRRFHAQPIACPECGPQLELWNMDGMIVSTVHEALQQTAGVILAGGILALKGLGGFQLIVDATNQDAVESLRSRKRREDKPFALMYPSFDHARDVCEISSLEERLLKSSEAPIVLLKRLEDEKKSSWELASAVAPRNPSLGIMLPYTPLHHLLMHELKIPIVATSGNISDEPICIDKHEALLRLKGIADYFLVHNRPIKRHVDDSVVRLLAGREYILRRARGYAPLPVLLGGEERSGIFAVGAHLKNTVALTVGNNVIISQHIGDLDTKESFEAFKNVATDLRKIYHQRTDIIVCDEHPDYLSTRYAEAEGSRLEKVQHHYAHIASCMAENRLEGSLLGVAWDGTGLGLDGTIWGGEFLVTNETSFDRVATFRNFMLPGNERAVREPKRTAIGVLYEIFGDAYRSHGTLAPVNEFSVGELDVIGRMLQNKFNSPFTSSVGRLFDAVASITGIRQSSAFEGQAAMELEYAIGKVVTDDEYDISYRYDKTDDRLRLVDWESCIIGVINDLEAGIPIGIISAKFHNTLIRSIVDIAGMVGLERVVLSGGCFQNAYLLEKSVARLSDEGFRPYWHQRVPPNDGGIALGQIYAVTRARRITPPVAAIEKSETDHV
jgi:hydrogenase maturation protein HypF